MRSIGKKNIALVKQITREEIQKMKDEPSLAGIEDKIIERLPESLWDTWEMADQEIRSIINDEIMTLA